MTNKCLWFHAINLWSAVDWLVVIVSYHWMPKWFFWMMFVFAVLSDLLRSKRFNKMYKDHDGFE